MQTKFSLSFPQHKVSKVFSAVALIMCAFQLRITMVPMEPIKLRVTHVGFILILIFLSFPPTKKLKKEKKLFILDPVLAVLPVITTLYVYWDYDRLVNRIDLVSKLTTLDYIVFGLVILLVLEATRRTVGLAIIAVVGAFAAYAFLSPYLPDPFFSRGLNLPKFVDQMAMNLNGIYSTPIAVASTYVFLFVLFGSFLIETGAGQSIIDVANALTGKSKGGPAKVAVVSSMLFGTINGSSVANVITTGSFTIPMMKGLGYKKDFAGAVEAVASTGGQIMPPIMGAAAFVMAEIMGVPYLSICKAAVLPAILYYAALMIMVHLEADKLSLPTMPENDIKKAGAIFKRSLPLFLPIATLLYTLVSGYSPTRAGLVALGTLLVVGVIQKTNRLTPKTIANGLINGAKSALVVSITCATAGMVIGVVNALGIGFKFTSAVFTLSQGNLFMALILIMIATLILGMGLPTTAAYIIAASVAVPPLMQMGVGKMAANFFALYFACISSITPPVAVAAYAGAALAGGSPMRTGFIATKLGVSGFIVPFLFVYSPVLLLEGSLSDILLAVPTAIIGIFGISCALEGWVFNKQGILFRLLLAAGGLLMLIPGALTDLVGFALLAPIILYSYRQYKKAPKRAVAVVSRSELEEKASMEKIDSATIAEIDLDSDA